MNMGCGDGVPKGYHVLAPKKNRLNLSRTNQYQRHCLASCISIGKRVLCECEWIKASILEYQCRIRTWRFLVCIDIRKLQSIIAHGWLFIDRTQFLFAKSLGKVPMFSCALLVSAISRYSLCPQNWTRKQFTFARSIRKTDPRLLGLRLSRYCVPPNEPIDFTFASLHQLNHRESFLERHHSENRHAGFKTSRIFNSWLLKD